MIEVLWSTCSLGELPERDDWLTPSERGTLAGLCVAKRRRDWRLGRWTAKTALRTAWSRVCAAPLPTILEIVAAPDGAPELGPGGGPGPSFSLSHSGERALCAVARPDVQLGCDIEQVEPRSEALLRDFFSLEEREAVMRAELELRPLLANLVWSAKESALKARRTGLRADTRSVVVRWTGSPGGTAWAPLTVTPEDGPVLDGWCCHRSGMVLTVVSAPGCASPIDLSPCQRSDS